MAPRAAEALGPAHRLECLITQFLRAIPIEDFRQRQNRLELDFFAPRRTFTNEGSSVAIYWLIG